MHVLIHCNGGPGLGAGHVLRSTALAEEALARGHRVSFTGVVEGDFLTAALARLDVPLLPATDLPALVADLRPDVVHLDTYDEVPLAPATEGPLLSNLEDGPFGRRPADLVVDPNHGAEETPRDAEAPMMLLRGARFAPLRRLVTDRRGEWRARAEAGRVLVVMGGTDPQDLSPGVVAALSATGLPLEVTVVAPDRLHAACTEAADGVGLTLRSDVQDLPALMVAQDLVVSAAGTSVWELCCLGIPMALVCAVENQRIGYERVVGSGAAAGLGVTLADPESAVATLARVLGDADERAALADRAGALVDGRGSWRVVTAWEQLLVMPPALVEPRPLAVRTATEADAELLWRWRNDPVTRAHSRTTAEVALPEHRAWLEASLRRDDRLLLVASDGSGDVGTVRWDRDDTGVWEVSITVAPERRGAGLARPLLRAGERALVERLGAPTQALATVHEDNDASLRLFARAGYLRETPADARGFATFTSWLD